MRRKPPTRWLFLWLFLTVMGAALLRAPVLLHGRWNGLPLYMGAAAVWFAVSIVVAFARAVRARRLWIEDRRARGLKTYEQPRDAISNNPIVRWILFLPKQNSN
jgi:hypothetical protein